MKCVAYIRVSQEDENPENQKQAILEFAKRKGLEILGFFTDIDVSGTVSPRQRARYASMLEFSKENAIKCILFYDLSRLSRSLEEGLLELRSLADEGYTFYFATQEFLNYIEDPMLKKKIVSDFLWFAEMYVEDIKRRTRVALEARKKMGKLYHRPSLLNYVALYLSKKSNFGELTQGDMESAKKYLKTWLEPYLKLRVPKYQMHREFLAQFSELYRRSPKAPKSYDAFIRMLKKVI